MGLSDAKAFVYRYGRRFLPFEKVAHEFISMTPGDDFMHTLLVSNLSSAIDEYHFSHSDHTRDRALTTARLLYKGNPTLENLCMVLATHDVVGVGPRPVRNYIENLRSVSGQTVDPKDLWPMGRSTTADLDGILKQAHAASENVGATSNRLIADYLDPLMADSELQIVDMIATTLINYPIELHEQLAVAALLMGNIDDVRLHLDEEESHILAQGPKISPENLERLVRIQYRKISLSPHNTKDNHDLLLKANRWIYTLSDYNPEKSQELEITYFGLVITHPETFDITDKSTFLELSKTLLRKTETALKTVQPTYLRSLYMAYSLKAQSILIEDELSQHVNDNFYDISDARQSVYARFKDASNKSWGVAPDADVREFVSRGMIAFANFDIRTHDAMSAIGLLKQLANSYQDTPAGQMIWSETFWPRQLGIIDPTHHFVPLHEATALAAGVKTALYTLGTKTDDLAVQCLGGSTAFGLATKLLGGPVSTAMIAGCGAALVADRITTLMNATDQIRGEIQMAYDLGYAHLTWKMASSSFSNFALQAEVNVLSAGSGAMGHIVTRELGEYGISYGLWTLSNMGIQETAWLGNVTSFLNRNIVAYAANTAVMSHVNATINEIAGHPIANENFVDDFIRIRTLGAFGSATSLVPWKSSADRVTAYALSGVAGVVASETALDQFHPNGMSLGERINATSLQMLTMHGVFGVMGVYDTPPSQPKAVSPRIISEPISENRTLTPLTESREWRFRGINGSGNKLTLATWAAQFETPRHTAALPHGEILPTAVGVSKVPMPRPPSSKVKPQLPDGHFMSLSGTTELTIDTWAERMAPKQELHVNNPYLEESLPEEMIPVINSTRFPPMTQDTFDAKVAIYSLNEEDPNTIQAAMLAANALFQSAELKQNIHVGAFEHAFRTDAGVSAASDLIRVVAYDVLAVQEQLGLVEPVRLAAIDGEVINTDGITPYRYVGDAEPLELEAIFHLGDTDHPELMASSMRAMALALHDYPRSTALRYLAESTMHSLSDERMENNSHNGSVVIPTEVLEAKGSLFTAYLNAVGRDTHSGSHSDDTPIVVDVKSKENSPQHRRFIGFKPF